MFRIEENGEELFIKEFPVWNWLIYFVIFSILVNFFYLFVSEFIDINISSIIEVFFITVFTCLLVYIYFPITKIHINKQKQTLAVSKENLLKNEYKIYSFKEIEDVIFVEEIKLGFKTGFQLVLPLKNGEKLKLSSQNGIRDNDYVETAKLLNKFIFNQQKQIP